MRKSRHPLASGNIKKDNYLNLRLPSGTLSLSCSRASSRKMSCSSLKSRQLHGGPIRDELIAASLKRSQVRGRLPYAVAIRDELIAASLKRVQRMESARKGSLYPR